eukprot:1818724-Pyramimonas_sp.AAC.1
MSRELAHHDDDRSLHAVPGWLSPVCAARHGHGPQDDHAVLAGPGVRPVPGEAFCHEHGLRGAASASLAVPR